jgi:predicted DNA-binding transcriptional regulator AlpA
MTTLQPLQSAAHRRYLRVPEAAHYLGVSASLLNRLRMTGDGPRYAKISTTVTYDIEDLDTWRASKLRNSTSEQEPR